MLKGHRQITELVGRTRLFRPPYGKMSLASLVLARMKRLSLAWWTIDARDSLAQPRSHDDVLARISAAGGGVVLLHDWDRFPDPDHGDYVLGLIRKIATLAREKELRFATFSDVRGLTTAPGAKSRPSPVRP
jgi:peptidoglycan/xylan/chitin deacetylase (PgdA/CDA1 family)